MTDNTLNSTITRLILAALDAGGVTDAEWRTSFRISALRLERFRSGRATLTDAELDRISRVSGEPWEHLVLRLLEDQAQVTADTRELITSLHLLQRTAGAETAEHSKRAKNGERRLSSRLRSRFKGRQKRAKKILSHQS